MFCRLYFAATSGVCLMRSGAADFSKETTFANKNKKGARSARAQGRQAQGVSRARVGAGARAEYYNTQTKLVYRYFSLIYTTFIRPFPLPPVTLLPLFLII